MSATSLLGDRLLKSPCSTEAASSAFAMLLVRLPGASAGVGVGTTEAASSAFAMLLVRLPGAGAGVGVGTGVGSG